MFFDSIKHCQRRRRDLNPRAETIDLLPFQGSPFNRLGTSPCKRLNINYILHLKMQRRERDSNPRALADKRFSRPPRYDHFDISPLFFCRLFISATLLSYQTKTILSTVFFSFFNIFFEQIFSYKYIFRSCYF